MFGTSGMRKGGRTMTINEGDGPLIGRLAHVVAHLSSLVPGAHRGVTRSQWFERHPASVAAARSFTRDTLVDWTREESETVELLVSELVTNAVRHGAGPILLRVTVRGTSLRCEVTDAHPASPCLKAAGADDESGRGMWLLHELSHRCGVRPAHQGKTVWFELQAPGPASVPASAPGPAEASVPVLSRFAHA
ncbi:histidine kinase-like protein [Streptomyces sp. SLBN-118]|uniref:ATP-binding protein n=1 Tax=Streptomyces sp. SLBN-118 TaxID=2768454 RepID=UPI00115388F4|nr:histidine kinase-like protein [Streptomyces sp. SLBN-118]